MSAKGILRAFNVGRFRKKLVEYAYAAQLGKRNIYMNFAMNITCGRDCEGRKMNILMENIGIFASTNPVAIDMACYNKIQEAEKKFRGINTFKNVEEIGLGSAKYTLNET
jgi:uncharacterized Fe-S center protein